MGAGLTKGAKPEPPIVNADGNEEPATGNPPSATYSTSHCYDNKDYWYPEHPHESFMASAYMQVLGEEPAYTKAGWRKAGEQTQKIENGKEWRETVGKEFKDALFKAETEDYIHFSSDYFAATSVMSIPSYHDLDKAILLSDWKQPSDHFQIQADLEYGAIVRLIKSFGSIPLTPQERELLAEWKEHFGQDGNIPNATQFRKYATSVGKGIKYKRISALFKARDKASASRRLAQREFSDRDEEEAPKMIHARRRMAQREFSDRRDSPVMVRLLQEIVDAQDEK